MLTAGVLKLNAAGRVLIEVNAPIVAFCGGVPIAASGAVSVSAGDPQVFLGGFGYLNAGQICSRDIPPSSFDGGLGRDAVGALAFALTAPITNYIAGIPVTEDGRVAVAVDGPPPVDTRAFSQGFDQGFA